MINSTNAGHHAKQDAAILQRCRTITARRLCAAVVLALVGACGFVAWHFVQSMKSARTARANGRLAQTWLLIEQYRDVHGHFPPRVTAESSDTVPQSWRVEVLRYASEVPLSQMMNSYATDQSWDSELNERVASRLVDGGYDYFASPEADRSTRGGPCANVLAVVRSDRAEESIVPTTSDAVVLIINEESDVAMFEPVDISRGELRALVSRRGSVYALTAQGGFRVLKPGDI